MKTSALCKSPFTYLRVRPVHFLLVFALGSGMPSASAQIAFRDVSASAGFGGSASETWGASWGDVNGDTYPDIFLSNHRTRATLYRNNRDGTFTEVSQQVDQSATPGWTGGLATVDTHGVAWGDIDNDGDDDLFQAVESGADFLHTNTGGGLTNRTVAYGVNRLAHRATRQHLLFDYNGDGRLDLASIALSRAGLSAQSSGGFYGTETPLACTGDGQWAHLTDIHVSPGLELLCAPRNGSYPKINAFSNGSVRNVTAGYAQFGAVIDAATLDFDRDLRPDLFIVRGSERSSDAYQLAAGRFEAQFITAGNNTKSVRFQTTGTITVAASLQAGKAPEGDPAYIAIGSAQWSPGSLVFQLSMTDTRNWGIGTSSPGLNIGYQPGTGQWTISQGNKAYNASYVQVSSTAPITNLVYTGASIADLGYKPLLVRNTMYGLSTMANAGFNAEVRCPSVVAGDFDNDMDEDLFLACTGGAHNIPNKVYVNDGRGAFTELANAGGAAGRTGAAVASGAGTSDSVVVADYDRDGFLDLLVTNGLNMRPVYLGGPKQLFHNLGNANSWIEFDLVGTRSNRDGIGAKVYVTSGGLTQYREQNGGYHRWSQNSRRVHFGLAGNGTADVTVEWPDGTSTSSFGLSARRLYLLRQDGNVAVIPR